MENLNLPRYSRASQPQSLTSSKQRKSGYEPSDVETDWQETPRREPDERDGGGAFGSDISRNKSPMKINRNNTSPKPSPPRRRHNSKSPYKPRRDDGGGNVPVPISNRKNISPFSKSERRRQISPYKSGREEENLDNNEIVGSNRKQNNRSATREERGNHSQFLEVSRTSEKSNLIRRSVTAPRLRGRENDQQNMHGRMEQRGERTPSPLTRNKVPKQREASHVKAPSVGELNEMVANVKISRGPITNDPFLESTDSISPGDIFFSRDVTALAMRKNVLPKDGGFESHFSPKPPIFSSASHQQVSTNENFDRNARGSSSSAGLSRITMTSSSARSRKSSGKLSREISKISDASGSSVTLQKFTANRRKSQTVAWFACMRKASCRTKSPEKQEFDEASFIEKAFVVESLRQFWADKYQPGSLNGFTCHKQEAQLLNQIASQDKCPHILLKGPSGSGKRALAMAFVHEIYGDPSWNITHDLRYFQVPEKSSMQVVVPLTSSAHHVEVNVNLEANVKYALMGIVKEINNNYAIPPEVSVANFKADFKVIVLYEVDKAAEHIQHLIKWIMDCYADTCKLILCCEDDVDILESVKNRCKVLKVDAPVTHEIMEVLIQIARKEDFDLSMSFATKIATKSKQNLRKAIMALEACKAHNYPFVDDQPIPFGWEEVLVELAAEILADPSPQRLFFIRGKFQKLLVNFVHPKLILQKLVEHFLKGVDSSIKRELYYWHAYYDKRLPTGTTALLKLEEFVAKFMSIYRRSSGNRQFM